MRGYQWTILGLGLVLAGCGGGGGGIADSNPPMITRVAMEHRSEQVQVSATIRDAETGVAQATVFATVGETTQTVPMRAVGSDLYEALLPSNTARVRIQARDRAGNLRETGDIPAPPPQPPF